VNDVEDPHQNEDHAGEEDRRQQTACLGTVEGSRSKEEGDGDRGVSDAPA
jgi:hypothetical protein